MPQNSNWYLILLFDEEFPPGFERVANSRNLFLREMSTLVSSLNSFISKSPPTSTALKDSRLKSRTLWKSTEELFISTAYGFAVSVIRCLTVSKPQARGSKISCSVSIYSHPIGRDCSIRWSQGRDRSKVFWSSVDHPSQTSVAGNTSISKSPALFQTNFSVGRSGLNFTIPVVHANRVGLSETILLGFKREIYCRWDSFKHKAEI